MKNDIKLGTYVTFYAYKGDYAEKMEGVVVGIDTIKNNPFFWVKTDHQGTRRSATTVTPIYDLDLIQEIDSKLNGEFKTTPHELREVFAQVLGVKDANGWKTGEAIIEELLKRNGL